MPRLLSIIGKNLKSKNKITSFRKKKRRRIRKIRKTKRRKEVLLRKTDFINLLKQSICILSNFCSLKSTQVMSNFSKFSHLLRTTYSEFSIFPIFETLLTFIYQLELRLQNDFIIHSNLNCHFGLMLLCFLYKLFVLFISRHKLFLEILDKLCS